MARPVLIAALLVSSVFRIKSKGQVPDARSLHHSDGTGCSRTVSHQTAVLVGPLHFPISSLTTPPCHSMCAVQVLLLISAQGAAAASRPPRFARHLLEPAKPNAAVRPKGADTAKQAFGRLPKFSRHLLEPAKPSPAKRPTAADTSKRTFERISKSG